MEFTCCSDTDHFRVKKTCMPGISFKWRFWPVICIKFPDCGVQAGQTRRSKDGCFLSYSDHRPHTQIRWLLLIKIVCAKSKRSSHFHLFLVLRTQWFSQSLWPFPSSSENKISFKNLRQFCSIEASSPDGYNISSNLTFLFIFKSSTSRRKSIISHFRTTKDLSALSVRVAITAGVMTWSHLIQPCLKCPVDLQRRWCELVAEGTLFLKSVTIRGMADPPPSLFHPHPFFFFFFKRKCAHIWVAVMAALYFLCTWFNWLVLHLGVEFSLSLTVELVLCSNWSGQRRLGLKHFKSRCHSEKYGTWVANELFEYVQQLTLTVTAGFSWV